MAGSCGSISAKKVLSAVSLSTILEGISAKRFGAASGCGTKQILLKLPIELNAASVERPPGG